MQLKDEIAITHSVNEEYIADALNVVSIKFVDDLNNIDEKPGYEPEFAHQHFGEAEQIFGYKNLSVSICYSDSSLFIYPIIKYDTKISNQDIEPDDIVYKVRDQLPSTQLDALITNSSIFADKLKEQKTFKPFGELLSTFFVEKGNGEKRTFQLYKLEKTDNEQAIAFLERAQSLAFWYIDAVCYTDYEDPRFFNYFLFESSKWDDGSPRYIFAGYSTLYRFYYHPDMDRVRIAHILLSPAYRHSGIGVRFLNSIYADLRSYDRIYDITAESPADNFLYMRDYADCLNCAKLEEFSKSELLKGFSTKMKETARNKLKLHDSQARRVYEILRYAFTNLKSSSELEAFKKDVIKRLLKPLMRTKRDFTKLSEALNPKEMAVVSRAVEPDQQLQQVEELYENTISCYNIVVDRLRKYESKYFHY